MATNNHTNAIISQVNIGNTLYDIHDSNAIHTLADLGSIGMDTSGVFVFKGTVATVADLPTTGNKVGYVYHVTANHSEYIWAKVDGGTSEGWEEFGEHFVVSHTHSIPALSGSAAAQTWTQDTANSSVQITGSNGTSAVTGTISVPKPSGTTKYMKATSSQPTLTPQTDSVLGTGTTFSASGVAVGGTGTASAITGFGAHTTAAAITALGQTTPTKVTIPNVTAVGTASTWSFNVTDGVLTIAGANSTTPTLGTALVASRLGSSGTTKVYSSVTSTANAITALGTASTSDCLTGVTVTSQPSITVGTNDQVAALTGGTISTPTITLGSESSSATGRVAYISAVGTSGNNSVTISSGLTAAAQAWSQDTGTVVVKGTNAKSNVTTTANTTGQPA